MPLTLHPHLKRGLGHDDFYLEPADIIEDAPREHRDPQEQAAKRQRVEKIAAQYIQGRMPVILTASLRGPFNEGWKNPWAKSKKTKRRVSDKENSVGSSKNAISGKAAVRNTKTMEAKRRTRSAGRKALEDATVASPETSRAVHSHVEDFEESHTLETIEVPPATAPSPDHDTSGATEFFSVDTERCLGRQSPQTDPFWLQRPEPSRNVDMRTSPDGSTEVSPMGKRGTRAQPDTTRTLQLAVPKVPVGLRPPLSKAAVPNDINSSASASMALSSLVQPAAPLDNTMTPLSVSRGISPITGPSQNLVPASDVQPAQVRSVAAPMPKLTPATAPKACPAGRAPQSNAETTKKDQPHRVSREDHQEGPAWKVIQHSADQSVDMLSPSQSSNSSLNRGEQACPNMELETRQSQGNPAAQPIPDSSTGFVYKKVGSTKWSISNAPRSKPRAVNFNSSPATKDIATASKPSSQKNTVDEGKAPGAQLAAVEECPQSRNPTSGSQTNEHVQEQQGLRSSHSSQQSAMSTQAAMLLAQLEFQESTFPTSSSETPRPWSQSQEETPRPMLPEPSPAITPLSVFRPQLEQSHPLTSVLRGPPLSTQDLFAAASPFAFSTIKKKPEASQRRYLRMSLMSFNSHDDHVSNVTPQSPSYSDRVPLKEKNVVPSPWRFSFEKELRNSPESFKGSAGRSIGDVELPQLDLDTVLEDCGPTGSLHLADRLLRKLKDS
jgi:hypothetical protein